MRRAVPSFTVEVRRRPRLMTASNPDAQSSEARSPRAELDRASHRVAAAAFEAEKADPSLVEVASSPRGRILPSLVPDESLRRTLRDAAPRPAKSDSPSRVPKRPPVRTSKGKDQASKLPRHSRFSSDENAPLAERASTKPRQASGVQSPRVAATVQSQVVGDHGGLTVSARAKRRNTIAISRDHAIGKDSPATPPSVVNDRSPEGRKRTIMARYVFGDELKPGERWKRRSLKRR